MLLREEDTEGFKRWLLPKLETISDAEAEVLADYVIALVTADESEATIRSNCLESLADFLQDNTAPFVDDVVKALKSKSYASRTSAKGAKLQSSSTRQQAQLSQAGPIPSIVGSATNTEYEPHPLRSTNTPPSHAPRGPAATRPSHRLPDRPTGPSPSHLNSPGLNIQQDRDQGSKKRKQVERDLSEIQDGQDAHYARNGAGNRPIKQTVRRVGKNAMAGRGLRAGAAPFEPQNTFPGFAPMTKMPNMPNMLNMASFPPPPPGPVPFDVNNPMAFFAMMAALGTTMPGIPPLPTMNPQGNGPNGQARMGKCSDYHTKGYCALGGLCPFEHGEADDAAHRVPEYDPNQPSLSMGRIAPSKGRSGPNKTYRSGGKGGKPRANFSLPGPSNDQTLTTIVVEQIPEEHFSEDNIRGYFSQFGTIAELKMYAYRRLATVKFETHSAANQAYNSPKAVFENRFVKVYWMKPDTLLEAQKKSSGGVYMADADGESHVAEEVMSREEIAKRQAEAQKAFEERRRKFEEAEARAADIDRQLKEKDAEMRDIKRQLKELAGEDVDEADETLAKLATLQAEAAELFAKSDIPAAAGRGRGYPPRGAYQSRGFSPFASRGRGAPRGAYRGRGAFTTQYSRTKTGVRRLDNRPRRIAVAGIEKDTPKDEALRQYLVGHPECSSIELHPEQSDTVILTFQERYQAESFLDSAPYISDTGPLELSWVPNDAFGGLEPSTTTIANGTTGDVEVGVDASDNDDDGSSATIGEQDDATDIKQEADAEDHGHQADADMDVADDADQWL